MEQPVPAKKCWCYCSSNISSESIQSLQNQFNRADLKKIVGIKRIFLSEPTVKRKDSKQLRKTGSEPNVHYHVDYDDLCGPWVIPSNPAYEQSYIKVTPKIATWELLSSQDMEFVRTHMFDKKAIKSLIVSKLQNDVIFRGENGNIFSSFTWEAFKHMRDHRFNGIGIWSMLGLLYLTHKFFLSAPCQSPHKTYEFFREGIELHTVLKPTQSDQVFHQFQYIQLLELFSSMYMSKLPLLRSICLPMYNLILTPQPGDA